MNIRQARGLRARLPILPTVVVALAILAMVGLGFWQLYRLQWKDALLARYASAATTGAQVPFPFGRDAVEAALYRRSRIDCLAVSDLGAVSGRSPEGWTGWAVTARCATQNGPVTVMLGWSANPQPPAWTGGTVTGTLAPARDHAARLVADPPLAGLHALARPDPGSIPNNHFAYAMQWFLFAATALVIYGLALRMRLARGPAQR